MLYIEDAQADKETVPVFKLADLTKMFSARLKQLGMCLSGLKNNTPKEPNCHTFPKTCKHIKKVGTSFLCLVMMLV